MNERPPLDATVDIPSSGDDLDAGLAAAFGPDSGPPLPAGGSVLKALSTDLPSVPRILLREPDSFGGSPIVRPSSDEIPDKQDPEARLQLHGEIARVAARAPSSRTSKIRRPEANLAAQAA